MGMSMNCVGVYVLYSQPEQQIGIHASNDIAECCVLNNFWERRMRKCLGMIL
jgi:hypothetical protein